jgi:hypothetical protein
MLKQTKLSDSGLLLTNLYKKLLHKNQITHSQEYNII